MCVRRAASFSLLLGIFALVLILPSSGRCATLDRVKARGEVVCGTTSRLAGFAETDPRRGWSGFNVDYCRAVAATLFNDPSKISFVLLAPSERLSALQSGDIDILTDNIPWMLSREPAHDVLFTAINFFDGEGFMVHQKLNISSVLELSGGTVCVQQGTANE